MQNINYINENQTLASSVDPLNNAFASLLSQNSGESFPTTGLVQGQVCFRTDELALYVLANVEKRQWVKIAQLNFTYVNKEYVDSMHIPLERVDNIMDTYTNKIKMSLMNTGYTTGQLVVVGDGNKIPTSLLDTGTSAGDVLLVGEDGKISNRLLNIGANEGQIPILSSEGKLPPTVFPRNVATFDTDGSITFPNGNRIFVGG